jgi:hypothetical protein
MKPTQLQLSNIVRGSPTQAQMNTLQAQQQQHGKKKDFATLNLA